MPVDRSFHVEAVLAAAVATSGTFTIAYPVGTTQLSFTNGLAGTGAYIMLNDNEKWTEAAAKISLSFGASLITVTNLSLYTWAAGTRVSLNVDVKDGNDVMLVTIPLSALAGVTAADVVTEIRPGVYGTIEDFQWVQGVPVTTAAKLASFNLEIDTTNVTGGVIALTSALATPLGAKVDCTAITGNNTLTPDSKLSIEASSVTAFVEGGGFFLIRIRRTALYSY